MRSRNACIPWMLLLVMLVLLGSVTAIVYIPQAARQAFGVPNPALSGWQRISYGFGLVWNAGDLTQPRDPAGGAQLFVIEPGESVLSISSRLEQNGLIHNASTFRAYLLWTGLDTIIQSGTYRLSPAQTGRDIAQALKSTTLIEVTFSVLPGWRMEEIAASLPTSGLEITPDAFLATANTPGVFPDLIPPGAPAEGFLYPDRYILPRTTTVEQLVSSLVVGFRSHIPAEFPAVFAGHGLTLYQGVTLASIIQREAMVEEEMPLIASVFYNRLAVGMKLQTDPTVQYALGYNAAQGTWWTNPLKGDDMQIDSPYNTYRYAGLPPGPISNPSLAALTAAAFPAESPYYYFQAKCDGSGLHNFSESFEQHQQYYCP
jgi:UPF0755 protein